jgi:hypothetical protein
VKGYVEYEPHSPQPEGGVGTGEMFRWVRDEAKHLTAAKPWMLVPLEGEQLVAARRNWLTRVRTFCLNWFRRREVERRRARLAALEAERWRRLEAGIPLKDGTERT